LLRSNPSTIANQQQKNDDNSNAAFLDGKSFEYKNGETNGETTKMTFFGPSGEVLKFLVNPVNNLYRMGLTSGATFEEINCTEI
jgi:hypothetical protein